MFTTTHYSPRPLPNFRDIMASQNANLMLTSNIINAYTITILHSTGGFLNHLTLADTPAKWAAREPWGKRAEPRDTRETSHGPPHLKNNNLKLFFTLYPTYNRLDRGNLVCVLHNHLPPNSGGFLSCHQSGQKKILINPFPRVRIGPTTVVFAITRFCHSATTASIYKV